jgi:hypothetical protein
VTVSSAAREVKTGVSPRTPARLGEYNANTRVAHGHPFRTSRAAGGVDDGAGVLGRDRSLRRLLACRRSHPCAWGEDEGDAFESGVESAALSCAALR